MKKFRLMKIVWKSLFRKNICNYIYIICVIAAVALPIILYSSSKSIVEVVKQSQENVYGEFTNIYYDYENDENKGMEENSEVMDKLLSTITYDAVGTLYTTYFTQVKDTLINVGYVDSEGIRLGHIELSEGNFPVEDSEIALCKSSWESFEKPKIGDQIEIADSSYTVVGIVNDYGRLWAKGETQVKEHFGVVNAFVTQNEANKLRENNNFLRKEVLLVNTNGTHSSDEIIDNLYDNYNGNIGKEVDVFSVPNIFLIILFICTIIILYNVLQLSAEKIYARLKIYLLLGMTKKDSAFCINFEYMLLGIIGLVWGTVIGLLGTVVIIKFFSESIHNEISIVIDYKSLIATIVFVALTIIISNMLYKDSVLLEKKKKKQIIQVGKNNKLSIVNLACIEFKEQKRSVIALIFLVAFSITIINYSVIYKQVFSKTLEYVEVDGKMPFDYDFEFTTPLKEEALIDDTTIYLTNSFEVDGADSDVIDNIKNEKYVKKVYGYKENNKLFMLMNPKIKNTYINSVDGILNDQYDGWTLCEEAYNTYGYKDNLLVNTKLVGYSEEEILNYSKYVIEGKIDLEKINAGEEVILVAPAYRISIINEGDTIGTEKRPVEYKEQGAYNDEYYHVGDEILLSQLVSSEAVNGGISRTEAQSILKRRDVTVKVGGIIRSYVGWFDNEASVDEQYYLMGTNETFNSLGMTEIKYNRIRIYGDENADANVLALEMNNYIEELPNMKLKNLQEEMQSYKQLNFMINLFTCSLIVMVLMVSTISIFSQMLSKTQLNAKKYGLLRINGLSEKGLVRIWGFQVMCIGCIGWILSIGITLVTYKVSFGRKFVDIFKDLSPIANGLIFVVMMLILIGSLIPCGLYIKKKGLRNMLS